MKGESLAAAALSFAAAHGMDLVRFPAVRDLPLPGQMSIDRPHDLTQMLLLLFLLLELLLTLLLLLPPSSFLQM